MFTPLRVVLIVATLISSPAPVDQVWSGQSVASEWSIALKLVFGVPLGDFIAEVRGPSHDARLDWTSDGCSAPLVGGTGRTFDFTESCLRHDFAYRNFKRIDSGIMWTPTLRHQVDRVFLGDMRAQCHRRRLRDRPTCRLWSIVFYESVRLYAGP